MKVSSTDPKTGKEVATEIPDLNAGFFLFINDTELNDEQIRAQIEKMSVSADVKAMLFSFSKAALRTGKVIMKVGRKILDILFSIIRAFPNITFGVIFGLVVGALVAFIPAIGFLVGWLVTPIAVGFGFVVGAKADLEAGEMRQRIDAILVQFSPLRA